MAEGWIVEIEQYGPNPTSESRQTAISMKNRRKYMPTRVVQYKIVDIFVSFL